MKKCITLLFSAFFLSSSVSAQVYGWDEKDYVKHGSSVPRVVMPGGEKPFFSGQEKFRLSDPDANWFVSAKGGVAGFLGSPVGCGDMFDRLDGTALFSAGKWHSRFFGTRLTYQGFNLKNADKESMSYHNMHADLMFNVSSFFRSSYDPMPRWNLSPYVGFGVLRNSDLHASPFAVSYGVVLNHRITDRLYIEAEVGGTSTYRYFDGVGDGKRFGDNLLSASIGVSVGIGKQGFDRKGKLGILNSYDSGSMGQQGTFPKNDFRGLKDLNDRLGDGSTGGEGDGSGLSGIPGIDAPVLFFFKINSTELIDKQQLVNIKEIAGAVKEYGLRLKVIGAADSRTGKPRHNRALSVRRAKYIAKLLIKEGVPKDRMEGISRGGIDLYKPYTANRHTCVILYK